MPFIDHFSQLASQYPQYRPGYPAELFEYLAGIAPGRELAWDCGTGSGQAALALVRYFDAVIATDASQEQIANSFPHPRVDYRVELAENTSIERGSVDLITVGTAIHWFDFDSFYAEVRRVGKPGAVLAVWTYYLPVITPELDRILESYYRETLDGYWSDRLKYLDARYATLPFPFQEIEPPEFDIQEDWDLSKLLGFLASWSATPKYIEANGVHPLEVVIDELRAAWGEEEHVHHMRWLIHMRIGKLT